MQRRMLTRLLFILSIILSSQLPSAAADTAEVISAAFYPYRAGLPQQSGILPGVVIDQHHWQITEPVLPAELLRLVQAGDFTISIQETTDLPVRPAYIAATAERFQSVMLDGDNRVEHYQGGRPFPQLDTADPRAGEKAAWNFRYRDVPQTLEMRNTMQGVNNAGVIDRQNIGRARTRYGMHRSGEEENDTQWSERGVYMKTSFQLMYPADQEGRMRIFTLYDDDHLSREELNYNPQNRRIRKAHANFLERMGGGRYDVLMEEQPPFFFIGYIHEYQWTYKGEQILLVPGFLKAEQVSYGGKHNWYPSVPWELRRVVVLEATPKGAHPYGKRRFYFDAQTYVLLSFLSFDTTGAVVRLALMVHGHPDSVPGARNVGLPVPLGATWINFTQERAAQFVAGDAACNRADSPRRYELMELLRKGK